MAKAKKCSRLSGKAKAKCYAGRAARATGRGLLSAAKATGGCLARCVRACAKR